MSSCQQRQQHQEWIGQTSRDSTSSSQQQQSACQRVTACESSGPVPFIVELFRSLPPQSSLKIQGIVGKDAAFNINLQCGTLPQAYEMMPIADHASHIRDAALHLTPRGNTVVANTLVSGKWQTEVCFQSNPFVACKEVEIVLTCLDDCYQIAVNGKVLGDFKLRMAWNMVTSLVIRGNFVTKLVQYTNLTVFKPSRPLPSVC